MDIVQPHHGEPRTSILSLPDELLMDIFSSVKGYRPRNYAKHIDFASSAQDIANIRLVCRRFAATSSHLLVHYVCVDGLNEASLERLEAISRHPLIGKGVHIVRLVTTLYTATVANNAQEFAWHATNRVFGRALQLQESIQKEKDQLVAEGAIISQSLLDKWTEGMAAMRRVLETMRTWSHYTLSEGSEVESDEDGTDTPVSGQTKIETERKVKSHLELLRNAHQVYRSRYDAQVSLLQDDGFVKRFAAAMAHMPRAKALEVNDYTGNRTMRWDSREEMEAATRLGDKCGGLLDMDHLIQPMSWDQMTEDHVSTPPVDILFKLPVALQKAGSRLDRLNISTVVCAEDYYPLLATATTTDLADLHTAVNEMGLKSFVFMHENEMKPRVRKAIAVKDIQAFENFITVLSSSSRLERLRVQADNGWADGVLDPSRRYSFGGLLWPRAPDNDDSPLDFLRQPPGSVPRWQNLRDLSIASVPLKVDDIQNLATELENSGIVLNFLSLSRVNLIRGCWVHALDILRKIKVDCEKELFEPGGAECDEATMQLTGRYDKIFRMEPGQGSVADYYINGEIKNNPLRGGWTVDFVYSISGEEVVVSVVSTDEDEEEEDEEDDSEEGEEEEEEEEGEDEEVEVEEEEEEDFKSGEVKCDDKKV